MGGACMMYRTMVNQGLVFSSLVDQSLGTPHEAIGACLAAEGIATGVEAMGIWTTSSGSLLEPSGPA